MTLPTRQPAFPLKPALIYMTAAAVVAGALSYLGTKAWFGAQAPRATILLAIGLAYGSAMLGLLPVVILGPLGVMATVVAYFAGAAVRVLLCLLVAMMMVLQLKHPSGPLTLALMICYQPLLFTEVGLVGRYLWLKDSLPSNGMSEGSRTTTTEKPPAADAGKQTSWPTTREVTA